MNLLFTLFTAVFLPLIADATNSNNPTTPLLSRKDLRIGIVGGGVSGLSAQLEPFAEQATAASKYSNQDQLSSQFNMLFMIMATPMI
ncbi:hypothetical protein HDU76_003513 [Blyttiomyces sp. JEL0837]|nr:hypothetical protein HDU76_003513 [Blyttiomyces sp. JEL0837]